MFGLCLDSSFEAPSEKLKLPVIAWEEGPLGPGDQLNNTQLTQASSDPQKTGGCCESPWCLLCLEFLECVSYITKN